MDNKIKKILAKMTLEDKISLCNGADFWHSKAMKKYGIPSFMMSDGPHGLRVQKGYADMLGVNKSEPATCFPLRSPAVRPGTRNLSVRKEKPSVRRGSLSARMWCWVPA